MTQKNDQPQIILASQSAQRKNLLRTLALPFKVVPADIDEQSIVFDNAEDKAEKIARAKAMKVLHTNPNSLIIAADTFCYCQGEILEKPHSLSEAKAMLAMQSGQELQALTGYAFVHYDENKQALFTSGCELVRVEMRILSAKEIEHYVKNQPVLTWSAAFSPAYDEGAALIARIEGNFTAFSHGLPIDKLTKFLRERNLLPSDQE